MSNRGKKITWPVAAVLIAFAVCATLTAIFAPADSVAALLSGEGLVATLIAAYLRSPRDVIGGGE